MAADAADATVVAAETAGHVATMSINLFHGQLTLPCGPDIRTQLVRTFLCTPGD
jgi:hypothetical protein